MDKSMINAANDGALMDKTLVAARNLIFNIQFGVRGFAASRVVNRVVAADKRLEIKITKLTSFTTLVHQLECMTFVLLQNIQLMHAPHCKKLNQIIPSQTIINPKGNVSAITLKSGMELPQQQPALVVNDFDTKAVPLPFLTKTVQARNFVLDEELPQTFRKVEINIHVLDRKKLKGDVKMERNVYALIQLAMPKKCRDLGTLIVPCTIEPTGVIIQLANRSIAHPLGILKDVLVQLWRMSHLTKDPP
ncbi:hypothetical protein CR513_26999, partial [Mucuna pruriens]